MVLAPKRAVRTRKVFLDLPQCWGWSETSPAGGRLQIRGEAGRIHGFLPWVTGPLQLLCDINVGQAWKKCCYEKYILSIFSCGLQPSLGMQIHPDFPVKAQIAVWWTEASLAVRWIFFGLICRSLKSSSWDQAETLWCRTLHNTAGMLGLSVLSAAGNTQTPRQLLLSGLLGSSAAVKGNLWEFRRIVL